MSLEKEGGMRFKSLVDDCLSWEEVIERLEQRIEEVKQLKEQGYMVMEISDDCLYYALLDEEGKAWLENEREKIRESRRREAEE